MTQAGKWTTSSTVSRPSVRVVRSGLVVNSASEGVSRIRVAAEISPLVNATYPMSAIVAAQADFVTKGHALTR
jgi:hypothetical protein